MAEGSRGFCTKYDTNSQNPFDRYPGRGKHFRFFLGNLKGFCPGERRFFELAMPQEADKCRCFFQPFENKLNMAPGTAEGNKNESQVIEAGDQPQTFPEWKVQTDFRKLHWRQKKRMRRRIVYILPIGPFPDFVNNKVNGKSWTLFEIIQRFIAMFFLGMVVKNLEPVNMFDLKCKTRTHHFTKQRQVFIGDVQKYLKERLPKDGYCVIGLTWADLYPSEELNFILGEAQCNDGCAVVCFGHYEPQQYSADCANKLKSNSVKSDLGKSLVSSSAAGGPSSVKGTSDASRHGMLETHDVHVKQTTLEVKTNSDKSDPITCLSAAASESRPVVGTLETCDHVDRGNCSQEKIEGRYGDHSETRSNEKASDGDIYRVCSDTFGRINRIDENLIWRMLRAVSHELCHVFGMSHCWYFSCAMNESGSIKQAESQPLFLCPICLRKLQKALGFGLLARYQDLLEFFKSLYSELYEPQVTHGCAKMTDEGPAQTEGKEHDKGGTVDGELRFREVIEWLDCVIKYISFLYRG